MNNFKTVPLNRLGVDGQTACFGFAILSECFSVVASMKFTPVKPSATTLWEQ